MAQGKANVQVGPKEALLGHRYMYFAYTPLNHVSLLGSR